jgi:hypothetical protein
MTADLDRRIRDAFDADVEPVDLATVVERARGAARGAMVLEDVRATDPRRSPAFRLGAVAAAFLLLVGAGWLVARRTPPDAVTVQIPTTVSTPAPPPVIATTVRGGLRNVVIRTSLVVGRHLWVGYRSFGDVTLPAAGGLAAFDIGTGALVANHATPGAVHRGALATSGERVWFVADDEQGAAALFTVDRVGAEARQIDTVHPGATLTTSGDRLWVAQEPLQERDATDGHLIRERPAPSASSVVNDGHTTWLAGRTTNSVTRIDADGGTTAIELDPIGALLGQAHLADGILLIEHGASMELVDTRRGVALGAMDIGSGTDRPIADAAVRGHDLWVLTGLGEVVTIDLLTGARRTGDAHPGWAESPSTLFPVSDESALVCSADDTGQAFCRPAAPGAIPPAIELRDQASPPAPLADLREIVTRSDALVDRTAPTELRQVAATTDAVATGRVIGISALTTTHQLLPDPGPGPVPGAADVVTDAMVVYVRIDHIDHRATLPAELLLAPGDLVTMRLSAGTGPRSRPPDRQPTPAEAISHAPIGASIVLPLAVTTDPARAVVGHDVAMGGRAFLARPDGSSVVPLEPTLDPVTAGRDLPAVERELRGLVEARG